MSTRFQRAASAYKTVALLSFNAVMVCIVLNVVLSFMFLIRDSRRSNPVFSKYGEKLEQVYPGWDTEDMNQMLAENWNRPAIYADYTHFAERPIKGQFVSVSEDGYREVKNQGPWPLRDENINVFVFGGSTTFGYGLPDEQTLPSRLQEQLNDVTRRKADSSKQFCVYNFGVGWFYSTQERILLEKLLQQGCIPDIAIFVDGLNDSSRGWLNKPAFSRSFKESFNRVRGGGKFQVQLSAVYDVAVRYTPVGRLSAFVQRRLAFASDDKVDKPSEPNILKLESKYSCYVTNKALIEQACRHFAVTPIFVWQPVPGYKYDMQYHLFVSSDRHRMTGDFYTFMDERSRDQPDVFGENFLWCADIQADEKECLYVDNHHYTAKFTEQFANAIVDRTAERGLLAQRGIINK